MPQIVKPHEERRYEKYVAFALIVSPDREPMGFEDWLRESAKLSDWANLGRNEYGAFVKR